MMKMLILSMCYLLSGITFTIAYPGRVADYRDYRPRRSFPHQAMMFSGFYGRPNYTPEGSMTAFATKDTVATNTYAGNNYPFNQQQPEEEQDESINLQPTSDQSSLDEEQEDIEISTTLKPFVQKPLKRKQKPTRPPKQPTSEEEEEDEDDNSGNWPLQLGGRGYNAFFPIIFGGRGGTNGANTRSGDYEGGYPGAATAIANSFSTGKGGVASSHATAYGDPFLSMLLRSGANGVNGKKKNIAKNHD